MRRTLGACSNIQHIELKRLGRSGLAKRPGGLNPGGGLYIFLGFLPHFRNKRRVEQHFQNHRREPQQDRAEDHASQPAYRHSTLASDESDPPKAPGLLNKVLQGESQASRGAQRSQQELLPPRAWTGEAKPMLTKPVESRAPRCSRPRRGVAQGRLAAGDAGEMEARGDITRLGAASPSSTYAKAWGGCREDEGDCPGLAAAERTSPSDRSSLLTTPNLLWSICLFATLPPSIV